jgi:hypothetical protein
MQDDRGHRNHRGDPDPGVALAGYVFTYRSRSRDRETEGRLARNAHDHERKLARSSRAYEEKKAAYLNVMRYALNTVQRVSLTGD